MKNNNVIRSLVTFSLAIIFLFSVAGCTQKQTTAPATPDKRNITDMAGRTVTLPAQINKAATIGSVPVINSFVLALGEGEKIANNLPPDFQKPRWKYQTVFAPAMAGKPVLQGVNREPNIEELLKASPDVIFTMNKESIDIMEKNGLNVVYLEWREPEDVKKAIMLVGEVLNKKAKAEEYIQYFDQTLKKVNTAVAGIPEEKRPKVLYCTVKTLSQPHLIAEWWIETAGGSSVTNDGRKVESVSFSMEQMLQWDPDVIIVNEPIELDQVYKDERFSKIKAVVNNRVFTTPVGAHIWAHRTIEQPLTVLWAAKTFYPEQFKDLDLEKEVQSFYERFFNYKMSQQEAKEILSGKQNLQ